MGSTKHQTIMGFARTTARRAALAVVSAQVVVIGGLVAVDAYQKRQRTKREGFPQPGTFSTTIGETATTVYTYGEDLFDAMIGAIDGAEHQVLLETYIWKGDAVGARFRDAVNRAAERGVKVFVIYDGFANLVVRPSFYSWHPLVNAYRFPVLRLSILFTNIRGTGLDHRKLLVVDDEVGFVGGYNIGSLYATKWRDTHLEVRGPSVWDLREAFVGFWNLRARAGRTELPDLSATFWEPRIRAVNNIPANLVFPIRGMYLDAINRAQRHIFMTTAYFIPDRQILDALLRASRRGVDVRVLLPEDSNHVVSDWLSRGFYSSLIGAGVQILLYQNSMIHAKTATIDGQWSTVGTANIDRLSLTGNYEINLEIFDQELAAIMENIFEVDSSNSRVLTEEEWDRRHFVARASEIILAPLRPFL
ncbi:phosphatidylserine/phosphatidylglycerophosphate/cardiolipin synthase family protein [Arthrobacter echini]|uniref:Phosphatidylserine/phosphatidylglycerophosphate/ cardiolipin synthase family protein n=2 Tax=Arthrobacter echini TaxID=1529066 RepID=A0A5D0XSV0_9MICC|nr:phosphatidylserine/phosphatidylglycerophosphate/cardiolipin synthase family protein [Arthrobacter echini]